MEVTCGLERHEAFSGKDLGPGHSLPVCGLRSGLEDYGNVGIISASQVSGTELRILLSRFGRVLK